MKVLQLISSAGYYGAEAMVVNLSAALERAQHAVLLAVFENSRCPNRDLAERATARGIETITVPCSGRFDRVVVRTLRGLLQDRDIDVVHTHGYKANFYGYAAAKASGKALIATCHNWTGGSLALRFYDCLDHIVLRGFPHIAAVSKGVSDSLERYRVPANRISIVPNGIVGIARRKEQGPFAAEIRKRERPVIALVGRLVLEKGGEWLLRAAAEVLRVRTDALFVFVGDGPAGPQLKHLAESLGIAEHVIFAGRRTDMDDVYSAIDILVLPSQNEAMPMTVIEAMYAEIPVVATRVGALDQVVEDGRTGILVDETDLDGFTRSLVSLVNAPATASVMGKRGRERAEQLFSAERMTERYVAIYRRLSPVMAN